MEGDFELLPEMLILQNVRPSQAWATWALATGESLQAKVGSLVSTDTLSTEETQVGAVVAGSGTSGWLEDLAVQLPGRGR